MSPQIADMFNDDASKAKHIFQCDIKTESSNNKRMLLIACTLTFYVVVRMTNMDGHSTYQSMK
eukprot:1943511-Prorocentrum_lima.AAC.1